MAIGDKNLDPIKYQGQEVDNREHDIDSQSKRVLNVSTDGSVVGVATEAKQDTGNASLASIKTNTDTLLPLTTIYQGTKTVPTVTATALSTTQAIKSITIKALSTNTVAIYIGASGVTVSDGFELLAGESLTLDIDDISKVFCISGSASQNIRYIAL